MIADLINAAWWVEDVIGAKDTGSIAGSVILREMLNGALFPLNVALLIAFGFFLYQTRRMFGPGWSKTPGVPAACALWWIFFCDAVRAGLVWLTLKTQNDGGSVKFLEPFATAGFVIAAVVGVAAILRCIYIFTPKWIGHWGWIFAAGLTFAFLLFAEIF